MTDPGPFREGVPKMHPTRLFRKGPAITKGDPGAEFIQHQGYQYHEAWGEKTFYNEQTAWFEPLPETEYSTSDDELRIALEEYNATTEDKYRLDLTSSSINDVLLEIAEATGRYNAKEKGMANLPRQAGRSAGDYAEAIAPWLDLIPSDNGLSLLSSGLKAILNITKKNAENRQKILDAFGKIPDVIAQTQKQRNVFTKVPKLGDEAIALYKVLVRCLTHLIAILNPSKLKESFREQAKRFGKKLVPYHTASDIDRLLGEVETSIRKFSESLQLVRDEYLLEIHNNGEKILSQGRSTHTNTEHIEGKIDHMQHDINNLIRISKENDRKQQLTYVYAVSSQNFLLESFRSDSSTNAPLVCTPYVSQQPNSQSFLSGTELFHALKVNVNEPSEDVEYILKRLGQFDVAAQAQAQQLLLSEAFLQWIKSPLPQTLLVKGNYNMTGPGRISALSELCATLSLNISKNTNYIVLRTFCGLHEAQNHQNAGPNWLIRSLIAQLLLSGTVSHLVHIDTRAFAESIKAHALRDLCSLFRQLIERLPKEATVICIIDGVSGFESETWRADFFDVLYILNQTVLNEYLKTSFKLLLTTPFSRTMFIESSSIIWCHYTVSLLPMMPAGGREMSERGLVPGRSLEEYRARMAGYQENNLNSYDDSDDEDGDIFW